MHPYPTVLYLPSIPSLILSFFTCDLPQQFNKFTFSLRGVGGRTVALGLSEGSSIFCSAEAYIVAKSITAQLEFNNILWFTHCLRSHKDPSHLHVSTTFLCPLPPLYSLRNSILRHM